VKKNSVIVKKETLFDRLPSEETGISFSNQIEENINNFFAIFNHAYNGGGVSIGDINNDGLTDIYFTGNQVQNKLYLNKGDFKFEDITDAAGVAGGNKWCNGVVMADVNGDNFLDIYVCRGGWKGSENDRSNLLYINNGDNTFTENAKAYGIADTGYSMMASFFDMDNDNDLDMYLINRPGEFYLPAEEIKKGRQAQSPYYRDKLYENVNGVYTEIGLSSGIDKTFSYGLGLSTSDLNNDGYSDVYVANDYFESDYFFQNNGDKTFSQKIESITNHVAFYGMGVDVVDFNNDGFEDIIELDMTPADHERSKVVMTPMNTKKYEQILNMGNHHQYMHNMLQINNGNGFFSEIGQYAGIDKTDWSWACLGSDFDNDGYRDLFISNGYRRDVFDNDIAPQFVQFASSLKPSERYSSENISKMVNMFHENKAANHIYKNNGDLKFISKIKDWGLEEPSFSNGAAVGDLDNDGDLDLVINNINDKAFIYQNNAQNNGNNFIKIKLKGPDNNSYGLGTKITLYHQNAIQYHELKNVRGYLSSVDPVSHFGLGEYSNLDSIVIAWPDGKENKIYDVKPNHLLAVSYKEATTVKRSSSKDLINPIFEDITKKSFPGHTVRHIENAYNDFEDQVLLPHKLSTEGPCIAVADINNDGLEDFYLGGASSQKGRLFIQKKSSKFIESLQNSFLADQNKEDIAATFFDANGDDFLDLLVVSGGNEFPLHSKHYQDRLYLNDGTGHFTKSNNFPELLASGGCVTPIDYDNDGDLDLFIGGRLVPKQYPKAARSYVLNNTNGIFTDVTDKVGSVLKTVGMVTDAVWHDIDGDLKNELMLVGEWMPIMLFRFDNGVFKELKMPSLDKTNGWWNSIESKDIDLDGDLDFVLGNLGENYKFKASKEKPFYVFASDYDNNGTNDIFLAKNYKDKIVPVRGKECSTEQMPGLSKKFKSYRQFAKADIGLVLGPIDTLSQKHEAFLFKSILLKNNNGELQISPLPGASQYSTVQDCIIEDFTNDGISDILIAGNKFNVEIETTRADASIGLLLKGKGHDNYKPLHSNKSGVILPENIKALKKIKLGKGQKRIGILVGINNGAVKLLKLNPTTK
jgi:hypothetical protein